MHNVCLLFMAIVTVVLKPVICCNEPGDAITALDLEAHGVISSIRATISSRP